MGKKGKGRKKAQRKAEARAEAALAAGLPASGVAAEPAATDDARLDGPQGDGTGARHRAAVPAAELAARLAGLNTVLQRHLARTDAGDGLTRARLSALALLVMGGPRTLGDLAAAEQVRPPTMTRLVHAMESDGLVARQRNPADGRSIIIRATPGGERALALGRERQIAPLADGIAGLPGRERRQLEDATDLLGRLLRDASWESAGSPE